jgi:hypothetical protein
VKLILNQDKLNHAKLEISPQEILTMVNDRLRDGKLQADTEADGFRIPGMTKLEMIMKIDPKKFDVKGQPVEYPVIVISGESFSAGDNSQIISIDEPHDPNDE